MERHSALPGVDAQEHGKPLASIDDLGALLDAVRTTRRPLLLFFTTPGCPYCREVRRNYLAPRVADRIGLIRTMAFTHIPANLFLILAATVAIIVVATQ